MSTVETRLERIGSVCPTRTAPSLLKGKCGDEESVERKLDVDLALQAAIYLNSREHIACPFSSVQNPVVFILNLFIRNGSIDPTFSQGRRYIPLCAPSYTARDCETHHSILLYPLPTLHSHLLTDFLSGKYQVVNQILAKGLHNADQDSVAYTTRLMDELEQVRAIALHKPRRRADGRGEVQSREPNKRCRDRRSRGQDLRRTICLGDLPTGGKCDASQQSLKVAIEDIHRRDKN